MYNVLHELIDVFEKKMLSFGGRNFCGKIKTIVAFTFKGAWYFPNQICSNTICNNLYYTTMMDV
jgi:hypothetical protein